MAISLNPRHIKRYAQLARLLMKYGRSDWVREAGLDQALAHDAPAEIEGDPKAEELASDLEAMGPTFIKLGQLLGSRTDILPPQYIDALSRLQQHVEPFPQEEAVQIVEEELGVRLSKAFSEFNREPIASASLGQVHRAVLTGGRKVAVKVQRPGIRQQIVDDFEALGELAEFADSHTELGVRYRFAATLDEMRRAIINELDYTREATNLATLRANLQEFGRILVPEPVDDYTTSRVLTMEFVEGRNITKLSPLARMEINGADLAEELFRAYLKQVLEDGFFHADPHPGNVFLTDDGRIALIDVGMVGRLSPELQDGMLRMLLAMTDGRGRDTADIAIELGERTEVFDREGFRDEIGRLVLEHFSGKGDQMPIGSIMLEQTRAAGDHGLIIPPALAMLGKTMLNLDQVGRTLDPTFQPDAAVQRNAADLMRRRMLKNASPSSVLTSLLETNDFIQKLPGRLNRVFDSVEERDVELKIRIVNDSLLLDGLQKIANRIATGAVLAAIIVAAAMLMRVETSFRIFGYPGLAMILFASAAALAVFLLLDVARHDRWARRSAEKEN